MGANIERKNCVSCGTEISGASLYCPNCGAKQTEEAAFAGLTYSAPAQPAAQENYNYDQKLSFELFWEQYAAKNTKGWDKAVWILALLSGVLNLLVGLFVSVFSLVDAVVFIVLGVLYKKKHSKKLALIITIVCALCTLIGMANGNVSGIVFLIAAFMSYKSLKKLEAAYEAYLATGETPAAPI